MPRSKDTIAVRPDAAPGDSIYRIVMIPGNPGLVSFYDDFLYELAAGVADLGGISFVFDGYSLAGFEVASPPPAPFSLQDQIEYVEQVIHRSSAQDQASSTSKIILIGHSVGSYILLEVLRRHRARRAEHEVPYHIVGGICLFPTVVDIAKSTSGQRVTRVLNLPNFAPIAHFVLRMFGSLIPRFLLTLFIRNGLGFPEKAADTVLDYLQSPMGLRETFHMAKDEMNEITADRWKDDIWGSATTSPEQRTKLYFYFGKDDHWVSTRTRDALITARARRVGIDEDWKPIMDVDTQGTPHGFCIRHSKPIAIKCAAYIADIMSHMDNNSSAVG